MLGRGGYSQPIASFSARTGLDADPSLDRVRCAVHCPLSLLGTASYTVLANRLTVSLHASFLRSVAHTPLRFASFAVENLPKDYHVEHCVHARAPNAKRQPKLPLSEVGPKRLGPDLWEHALTQVRRQATLFKSARARPSNCTTSRCRGRRQSDGSSSGAARTGAEARERNRDNTSCTDFN